MTTLLDRSERRKCLWSIQKGYESVKKPMAHAERHVVKPKDPWSRQIAKELSGNVCVTI